MQDEAIAYDGDGQGIYGETGKDAENGSSIGGYKNRRRKKGMTIPNNPEWEYCQRKVGWCQRRKMKTTITCQKGGEGTMKAYGWMGRTTHLMTSGITDKVIKIVVITGIMQKTVLKRAISTLATLEAKAAIQLRIQKHRRSLST